MMGQGRDHNKSAGVHWNETIVRQEKEAKGGIGQALVLVYRVIPLPRRRPNLSVCCTT